MCTRMQRRCVHVYEPPEWWSKVCSCDMTDSRRSVPYEANCGSSLTRCGSSTIRQCLNETPQCWVVMPHAASYHDSAHLWYLNDKSSKIHIYATWSKVRKRYSKANFLSENGFPKCLPGRNVDRARPRGHGELANLFYSSLLHLLIKCRFLTLNFVLLQVTEQGCTPDMSCPLQTPLKCILFPPCLFAHASETIWGNVAGIGIT